MATFIPAWYADPQARDLFAQFPLPLVIASPGDEAPLLNERFTRLLDPACLEVEPLLGILRAADACWHPLRLPAGDGRALQARVQARTIQGGVLLVVDEAPQVIAPDIAQLQARIVELERLSATDGLTGLWNRGHFDRVLDAELSRSLRFRQPISLVLLDVDHFKEVNDRHGHAIGDAVLRTLVAATRSGIRAADLLFRWGGEELVVLAPSTGYRGAEAMAENLRHAVESQPFPAVERITISLGVAEHLITETADAWFARVDAALYAAKSAGRNRVHTDRQGSSDVWAAEHRGSALRLVWQEAYECGEAIVDGEHRDLFDLANRAIAASMAGDREAILQALDALLAHTEEHFRDEERLLAQRGYAHLHAHARAHASLLKRAATLRDSVAQGQVTSGDLVEFLAVEVVARHLFTMDRDFFALFSPSR